MTATLPNTTAIPLILRKRRWHSTLAQILGIAMVFVGLGLAISTLIEVLADGPHATEMAVSAALMILPGLALAAFTDVGSAKPATVFAAVAGTWLIVSILGAMPYLFSGISDSADASFWVNLSNAIFESTSGFSCTGSTILTNLPDLHDPDPQIGRGMLFWRQLTQWYGGMGIVVLVLAVLPALGVDASGFMAAEAPGPTADRLEPRMSETAKKLWFAYVIITGLMAVAYLSAGMSVFDAIAHALATAATGGFSIYNDSIGEFNSIGIEIVVIVAMLVGGSSFALHVRALRGQFGYYGRDAEFRTYLKLFVGACALVVVPLWLDGSLGSFGRSLRYGAFNVATLLTSTGFGNAQGSGSGGDFVTWIPGPQIVLLCLMFIGGCSGSTSGGVKVIRFDTMGRIARRVIKNARHPRAVIAIKQGPNPVPEKIVDNIAAFIFLYFGFVVVGTLALSLLGTNLVEALTGTLQALGNMGPGLSGAGPTATFLDAYSAPARMILAFLMLVGRLELFAMLLMFAGPFRRVSAFLPNVRRVRQSVRSRG